jgi:hypothetical protein
MKTSVLVLLVAALAAAGCGNNSSVTAPSTPATPEAFSGSLPVQGSSFYSFTVATAGTVSLSLSSLTSNPLSPASSSVVRLGLGVPLGTGCSVSTSIDTAAGLTTQLTAPVNPDVYCVNIADIGNLTGPTDFTILIRQNFTPPSSTTAPVTETFASFLASGGSSTHRFPISQGGTISITLTSVTPSAIVGLGIGIPGSTSSNCEFSSSLSTTSGTTPQLTVTADAGTYCVQLYDPGGLNSPGVSFSATITHP